MRFTFLTLSSAIALVLTACQPAGAPEPASPPAAATPAPVPAAAAPAPAEAMRAFGNEPFWEMIDQGGGTLRLSTPDNIDGTTYAAARTEDAAAIRYVGKDVTLTIIRKNCSDGMSDATHPYTATMTLDGKAYSGCAAPASDLMPAEDGTPAAAAADAGPVTRFSANGFSPAWRAEVDGDTVKLDVPEHKRVDPGFTTIKAERAPYAKGVEFSGKDGDVDFVLTIDGRSRCEKAGDAEGRTNREFSATLSYGKSTYEGCADAVK